MNEEIPVYLFTGFLEAGKTKFIQETLEDERFNTGENTLLLLCEEGIEEYDPAKWPGDSVTIRTVEDETYLTPDRLSAMAKRCGAQRVIIEYNGMWMLNALFQNVPDDWTVYQEMLFIDSTTIRSYNQNMRTLVVDKLNTCDCVVFNRMTGEIPQLELHQLVRTISRRADIAYDYQDGHVEYDEIEDPLPFDLTADVVKIEDRDFAVFYRDLMEEPKKYQGKVLRFTGVCAVDGKMPKGTMAIGRHVMTCCAEDIQYCCLLLKYDNAAQCHTNEWYDVTAKLTIEFSSVYRRRGPVLTAVSVAPAKEPEQKVATFF